MKQSRNVQKRDGTVNLTKLGIPFIGIMEARVSNGKRYFLFTAVIGTFLPPFLFVIAKVKPAVNLL